MSPGGDNKNVRGDGRREQRKLAENLPDGSRGHREQRRLIALLPGFVSHKP